MAGIGRTNDFGHNDPSFMTTCVAAAAIVEMAVAPRTVGDTLARPPENLGLYKPDDRSFCGDLKKGDAIAGI